MWIFSLFFIFQGINCFVPSLTELCLDTCMDEKSPTLAEYIFLDYERSICQTGCRLFNIRYGGVFKVNPALKHCHKACKRKYNSKDLNSICFIGCELLGAYIKNRVQRILQTSPKDTVGNSFLLADAEVDGVDTDLLSDPSIKSQLEVGFDVDYKIPEAHIKTMPAVYNKESNTLYEIKPKDSGDWLDCASKNSGIPKWILLSTMLGAIMVAIWLILSMESRKDHEDSDDDMLVEVPEEKHKENYVIERDAAMSENDAFNGKSKSDKIDVDFLPPPTYSEVTEPDSSEPPNYNVAVRNREVNA